MAAEVAISPGGEGERGEGRDAAIGHEQGGPVGAKNANDGCRIGSFNLFWLHIFGLVSTFVLDCFVLDVVNEYL